MSVPSTWSWALPALIPMGVLAWIVATARRNVGLVDIAWGLFFLVATIVYVAITPVIGIRSLAVLALVGAWSLRLSGYLAVRNWNAPEDRRYTAMRERNDPGFWWKSLYLVFGLQVVLAWLVSAPLAAGVASDAPPSLLDALGAALVIFGIAFESVADAQLAHFKSDPANKGRVMDRGLWRYTRHPNYFGEFCVWWGFYAIALSAGAWWTLFSPAMMTVLLLKVSGVALLEQDIGERRPAYRDYIERTNAFFPGTPRGRPS